MIYYYVSQSLPYRYKNFVCYSFRSAYSENIALLYSIIIIARTDEQVVHPPHHTVYYTYSSVYVYTFWLGKNLFLVRVLRDTRRLLN